MLKKILVVEDEVIIRTSIGEIIFSPGRELQRGVSGLGRRNSQMEAYLMRFKASSILSRTVFSLSSCLRSFPDRFSALAPDSAASAFRFVSAAFQLSAEWFSIGRQPRSSHTEVLPVNLSIR